MTIVEAGLVPLRAPAIHRAGPAPARVRARARRSGDVYAADWRGGVMRIAPDGTQQTVAGAHPARRPAAAQRHSARERRHVPGRAPGRDERRGLPPRTAGNGDARPDRDRRQADAADQLRHRGCRRPALDHRQHVAVAARARLSRRRCRRLRRPGRPPRRAHRCRRTRLHQRARTRSIGPLAVGQRDVRAPALALRGPRRRLARSPADRDDVRQGLLPGRPRLRCRRACVGREHRQQPHRARRA